MMTSKIPAARYVRLLLPVALLAVCTGSRISAAGSEIHVRQGESFQNALDVAMPGDTILLEEGATFVGDFILPNKPGSSYITIRSAASDAVLPAPGQRTGPKYAPSLPKLQAASGPALLTADGAHHWRFENLEFLPNPNRGTPIILLGALDNHQTSVSLLPHHIVFDRIYMHDDPGGSKRGIQLNAASTEVINSYIAGIRREGQEAQGLCGWNGPGPFLIENNYIEGAAQSVLFGGGDPDITGLIPSDIVVRRNHMTKPLSWQGQNWTIKNVFELKNAQRVVIDGNIFENSWAAAQAGYIILFTGLNDGGRCTWCTVKDVTFTNNIVRHGNAALQITGRNGYSGALSTTGSNILVRNNLFYDINTRWGGSAPLGRFALIGSEMANVTMDHNTVDNDGPLPIMFASYANGAYQQLPGLALTNNLLRGNDYGVRGDNSGSGTRALEDYVRTGYQFLNNVLASDSTPAAGGSYPPTTQLPTVGPWQAGFVDPMAGNYRLNASSPYKGAGTDGKDIGVDMEALERAINGYAVSATPPTAPTNVQIITQ